MVKLVVAYGPPDDPAAFDAHYAHTHEQAAAADVVTFASGGATMMVLEG